MGSHAQGSECANVLAPLGSLIVPVPLKNNFSQMSAGPKIKSDASNVSIGLYYLHEIVANLKLLKGQCHEIVSVDIFIKQLLLVPLDGDVRI